MLNKIEEANLKLIEKRDSGKFLISSQDVKALYPSLEIKEASEIIRKSIVETEILNVIAIVIASG